MAGGKPLAPFIFRFPYLSLTTLAALTPGEIEVTIEDENVQDIFFDDRPDLVAISIITPLAKRGYAKPMVSGRSPYPWSWAASMPPGSPKRPESMPTP